MNWHLYTVESSHLGILASLMAQWYSICLPMQEMGVQSLGWEDPLEKEMATHSTVLTWRLPWVEELVGYSP